MLLKDLKEKFPKDNAIIRDIKEKMPFQPNKIKVYIWLIKLRLT